MRVLLGSIPFLPQANLQGSLVQQPPVQIPTELLHTPEFDKMAGFWRAVGIKPKPVVHFSATLSLPPAATPAAISAVNEARVQLEPPLTVSGNQAVPEQATNKDQ